MTVDDGVNTPVHRKLDTVFLVDQQTLIFAAFPSETNGSPTAFFLPTKAMGDSESLPELIQTLESACNNIDVVPFDYSVLT